MSAFKQWMPVASSFHCGFGFLLKMKEGFDKEIDSLLRRRARGATTLREDGDGVRAPVAVAHLDADELGAFAEGALPASARIAAASHLADCDECRGIVVGLTRVSGVGEESKKHAPSGTVPTVAAWRAWLASIFAPRVLRFAAPALALCVVAVVSFIALRSRQGAERNATQVARNERRQSAASKDEAGDGAPSLTETANANANVGGPVTRTDDYAPHNLTTANSSAQPPAGRGHGAAEATPPAATETKTDEAPPTPPDAPKPEGPSEATRAASKAGSIEEGESVRTENKEKTEHRAEPVNNDVALSDQPSQQKRAGQSRANEVQMQMPDGSRNQKRAADNSTSNAAGGSGNDTVAAAPRPADRDSMAKSAPASRRGGSAAIGGQRQEDDEDLRRDESRSAAGHRFRREGGAWVDVNYKSSMSSTGVRRGTDGYRALVADFPEIGRIAEQIGGEVVVVVRGRAYRIR
jgi:hypothetical protein